MATQTHNPAQVGFASVKLGAATVALAGIGLLAYGTMFLVRNFNGFIELGITADLIDPERDTSAPRIRCPKCHWQPDGSSTWITGAAERADTRRLRAESDAVLVGAGTVRADNPMLTVRNFTPTDAVPAAGLDPLRVVLGRVPPWARDTKSSRSSTTGFADRRG